jgi:hypothetical protein
MLPKRILFVLPSIDVCVVSDSIFALLVCFDNKMKEDGFVMKEMVLICAGKFSSFCFEAKIWQLLKYFSKRQKC